MIGTIRVIGSGRAGSTLAGRLRERGLAVTAGRDAVADAELVLLCVPDGAIATVAAEVPVGPWIAHVSGATSVTALAPHTRRFCLHPLQTLTTDRGPEQLDGAWAALTFETAEASDVAHWLADQLGLHPFELADDDKPLYHAGAAIASNFLVTLYRVAARLFAESGVPPEALVPLMRRVIENGFQPPADRPRRLGDGRRPPGRHRRAGSRRRTGVPRPGRGHPRRRGGGSGQMKVVRTAAELRSALNEARGPGDVGLVPTMGAYHDGHRSLFAAARAECTTVVTSLFVNPAQFAPGEDFTAYPRDEARDASVADTSGIDILFAPPPEEIYPPGFDTWVDPGALAETLEGAVRPGHFRGVATVCLKLFHLSRADLIRGLAVRPVEPLPATVADDGAIRERVLAILRVQPWWTGTYRSIVVTDGVVHLWGLVHSRAERDAMRVAAETVPGVRGVEDHLMDWGAWTGAE